MDALKIAFETVIVGALAFPWLVLLVDLFFPEQERLIGGLLAGVNDQTRTVIGGILLFALTYLLGSSVARVAEDFFNDDDLRVGSLRITEDGIHTAVYCKPSDPWVIETGVALTSNSGNKTDSSVLRPRTEEDISTNGINLCSEELGDRENRVRQVFAVQESSLLLAGQDKTNKLRFLHQQLGVLRGVALDGVIVTLFCLFGFCARHRPWGWRGLQVLSLGLLAWALRALFFHLCTHWNNLLGNPPLMEGMLIAIAVAGLCIAGRKVPDRPYGRGLIFSLPLTLLAIAGWWSTEILYTQTVIQFFYSQCHVLHAGCP